MVTKARSTTKASKGIDVSVLIPTFNEAAFLEETLARLRGQVFEGSLEFLFIDGRSTDSSRAMLERAAERDARIRVLGNPHRKIPHALNIGLRNALGTYVARMDAHTLYPPDYIGRGIERLKKGDVAWVSGPQLPFGTDSGSRTVAAALRTRIGIGGASFRKATREIEVDTGYTGIWLRSTLLSHGGWNEEWEVNEDSELAARVRAAGGRIVCVPELGARYIPRNSLPALARQYWRYGRYRAKTCRAHPESMRPSHVLPPLLVLALLTAAFPRRWSSRMSRGAVAVYLVALALAPASRRGAGLRPAVGMPMALATMHLAWGLGFLAGCARFGPPVEAIRGLLASAPRARG